ncbi:hypothetical protein PTSG_09348 [Salpingoeca rosetta]|uniref:Protein regulator of cytokinesis 1 n=1 Tax=Salpingoeca rosetta (strain ATCC 50818 / BSB-021) TaxID=946362 RepID=F2UMD5_SALR5|nr:uncharacterized protein PTSG_09348 [Salpingoeca rosetta]EGD78284.1 hypothetical protein PTSG_09348 [Salpingoeca rosetta]|eukprot:XP_004989607.1 hypothetical protein PTSG_09348 [Salpingoeca rosetta]
MATPPADLVSRAQRAVAEAMMRIQQVWHVLGIDEEYQEERSEEIMNLVNGLVMTMAEQEEEERDNVLRRVKENREQLASLAKEMNVEPGVDTDLPLLDLDKALGDRIAALNEEREQRIHSLIDLESRLEVLQESLVVSEKEEKREDELSMERLEDLRHRITEYEKELDERKKGLASTMKEIKHLWAQLRYRPRTEFEEQVAKGVDRLPLSPANILALHRLRDSLKDMLPALKVEVDTVAARTHEMCMLLGEQEDEYVRAAARIKEKTEAFDGVCRDAIDLWEQELERLHKKKQAMLPVVVLKTFEKLDKQWQQTYFCAQQSREFMEALGLEYPLEYDDVKEISDRRVLEMALEAIEEECARQTALHDEHKDVYQAVHTIEALQGKKAQFKEDDLLNNRGGLRFKVEKMDKQIDACKRQIAKWERQTGTKFMVRGAHFLSILTRKEEAEREHQLKLKEQRRQQRQKQLQQEARFGSIPATPKRARRDLGKPSTRNGPNSLKTPKSSRKVAKRTPLKENVPHLNLFENDIKGNICIEFDSSHHANRPADASVGTFSMFKETATNRLHSTKLPK